MSFGGSGSSNYGMHPGQVQQMNMQQQSSAMANRMMAHNPMRANAYPGYPGMQQKMGQGMSMMRPNIAEIVKLWPESWQLALSAEKNHDKKNQLLQNYFHKWQLMQERQRQYGMMQNGMVMQPGNNPYNQPISGGMPGMYNHMAPVKMTQNPATTQMRMAQSQVMPGMQPSAHVLGHHTPTPQAPSVTQLATPQGSVASPSSHLMAGHHPGQSPQVINPATPQNPASVQPGSIETNPPSQQDPEYVKMLQDLKKFAEPLKKVGDRCTLDGRPLPKAYDKLWEVIQDKRTVPKDLLSKLLKSTVVILDTSSLISPLLEEFKRTETDRSNKFEDDNHSSEDKSSLLPDKKLNLNPFSPASHLFIRLPKEVEHLAQQYKKSSSSLKKRDLESDNEPPSKIAKCDEPQQKFTKSIEKIEIPCMFGKGGRKWEMSEAATQELSVIPWKIDPDCVPSSYKSPDVTVCIDAKILLVPPLRVQIPMSYPEKNPVVQFDRSFPASVQVSVQLATLFERQLSLSTCRSITTIYESYKIACEELIRLKRTQYDHLIAENKLRQKVLV